MKLHSPSQALFVASQRFFAPLAASLTTPAASVASPPAAAAAGLAPSAASIGLAPDTTAQSSGFAMAADLFRCVAQAESQAQLAAAQLLGQGGVELPATAFDVRPGRLALETPSPEALRIRMARLAQPKLTAARGSRPTAASAEAPAAQPTTAKSVGRQMPKRRAKAAAAEQAESAAREQQAQKLAGARDGQAAAGKQGPWMNQALDLLEKARTPEEFKKLYAQLGGDKVKYGLPADPSRNAMLNRLEALIKKLNTPEVGFGMPAEQVTALQMAVHNAIVKSDNDALVKLAANKDAMRAAAPFQKAAMIKVLQKGWTKDSQDMAVAQILTSCSSKSELDPVVNQAGGPNIIKDIDLPEARNSINMVMGGWDRVDGADDKKTATAFKGIYTDPARYAELTKTRPPTDAELLQVLGQPPFSSEELRNKPALAAVAKSVDELRANMGRMAHDLSADPTARNDLAKVNQARKLTGQPPLDYTSLVTQAYKAANDPSVEAEVQARIAAKEKNPVSGKLKEEDQQKIREEVLEKRMDAVASQFNLSKQDTKMLVSSKMNNVMSTGAAAMKQLGGQSVEALQSRLGEVERTAGPDSPDAKMLREAIGKVGTATEASAGRLQKTGAAADAIFKVPPSAAEGLAKAVSVVGDLLATVVNVIPGVGQAISGAYFGVKAIVGLASGDVLGAFKSALSVVPGLSGGLGAASAALDVGARLTQAGIDVTKGIADGNALGVLGGMAGAAGGLSGLGGTVGQAAGTAQSALNTATTAGALIDSAVRGDVGGLLGGLSGVSGQPGAIGGDVAQGLDAVGRGAAMARSVAAGDVGGVLGGPSGVSGALGAVDRDVAQGLDAVGRGAVMARSVAAGDVGGVLGGLSGVSGPLGAVDREVAQRLDAVGRGASVAPSLVAGIGGGSLDGLTNTLGIPALRAAGAGTLADRLEAFGSGPEARSFLRTGEHIGQLVGAIAGNQPLAVGEALRQWLPELQAGAASGSIAGLAQGARQLLDTPLMAESRRLEHETALQAQRTLEAIAAFDLRTAELREFEAAAALFACRWKEDVQGMGREMLKGLGMQP